MGVFEGGKNTLLAKVPLERYTAVQRMSTFSRILQYPVIHMSLPLVLMLNRIGLAHTLLLHLCMIVRYFSVLPSHLCISLPDGFLQAFLQNFVALDSSLMLGTCPTHLILHKVIILITFGKEYKL